MYTIYIHIHYIYTHYIYYIYYISTVYITIMDCVCIYILCTYTHTYYIYAHIPLKTSRYLEMSRHMIWSRDPVFPRFYLLEDHRPFFWSDLEFVQILVLHWASLQLLVCWLATRPASSMTISTKSKSQQPSYGEMM